MESSSSLPQSADHRSSLDSSPPRHADLARPPRTSPERLVESQHDRPLELSSLIEDATHASAKSRETVLYLAYGSNLCRETFQGVRGIKPVSQVNVVVPQLVMTFDLAGLPYLEPCFANTRSRHVPSADDDAETGQDEKYHKDAWHKGLVGVVYEVTRADYAHIIATEGGGASYEDVLVDCYPLPEDATKLVPAVPSGALSKAHTLSAPTDAASSSVRPVRPDPSYAQPSPRYLKLITDGADELRLPYEYQKYLHSIRPFQITTTKQRIGKSIFKCTWYPPLAALFAAGRHFADKKGRYPSWLANLSSTFFISMWASYDHFFKLWFGDGERTMESGSGRHQPMEEQRLLSGAGEDRFMQKLEDSVMPHQAWSGDEKEARRIE